MSDLMTLSIASTDLRSSEIDLSAKSSRVTKYKNLQFIHIL